LRAQVIRPKVDRLADTAYAQEVVPLLQERLHTLGDFHTMASFFYDSPLSYDTALLVPKGRNARETARVLSDIGAYLESYEAAWNDAALEAAMRTYLERSKWDARSLFMALRVAMTGRTASPPLFATMQVLGREMCLTRLEDAVAVLQK
jgi:glutamyl-tRNA synthetase